MEELVHQFIQSMKLASGLNTRRIFEAWDQKEALVLRINEILRSDELFVKDDPRVGYVEELILK